MVHKLTGLNAIITGGASGLGTAVTAQLAAEGANICIDGISNDEKAGKRMCEELARKHNIKATFFIGDMSSPEDCAAVVKHTVDTLGGVDIIISNAGWTRGSPWNDLDAFSEEDWLKMFKINTLAVMWLFKAAAPYMKETYEKTGRAGVVLSTNSVAGTGPTGSSLPYSVTKSSQIRMIEGLALHNGPFARFNVVCPGLIITPWTAGAYSEERIQGMKNMAPLKKASDLEDVADCFMMLCKNDSITGKRFTVDCGLVTVS